MVAAIALSLYRLLGYAAGPIVRAHLRRRAANGREDPNRVGERQGVPGAQRPAGTYVWIHGASVGESLSALPLIERIRRDWPTLRVLVTTGTVTSARLMKDRLPDGVLHQYIPVDLPGAVGRFFDYWKPTLGLVIESELWPNLLSLAKARGINLVLVNGRMSATSFAGWRRFRPLAAQLLSSFDLVLAQSEEDQVRFQDLGAQDVCCHGNLKFAAAPLSADAGQLRDLQALLGERPRWLATSTHPGEEEIIARVHAELTPKHHGLLTIVAPRHPNRGRDIVVRLRAAGHNVARRGAGETLTDATDIYVADTIGELGLWYQLCEIVLIGGSLVPKGGQNALEPARLGCAIICGAHMSNFRRIADSMAKARALRRVTDEADLAATVAELLDNTATREALATAAAAFAAAEAGVLDDIVAALAPHLDRAVQSGAVQSGNVSG